MANTKANKKGVLGITLIELMIVLVIIGVLASLAIVRFNVATKKAKVKEAALMLAYLWDIQYEYYVANGQFICQEYYWPIIFEANLGFRWFDDQNEVMRKKLNYSPPSNKTRFWYISQYYGGSGGSGMITYAYPKVTGDFIRWKDSEVDNTLAGITLAVDNDRTIYVYGFGNRETL